MNEIMPNEHHYLDSGLDNVFLLNGFEITETPYGPSVSIIDVDGLHSCIARHLVQKPKLLTGKEFRFLRIELDMSQRLIGKLCGAKERTVRDWESSGSVADPANRIIRFIYTERFNRESTFEEFSKRILRLQEMDKQDFEQRLRSTAHGWESASEQYALEM